MYHNPITRRESIKKLLKISGGLAISQSDGMAVSERPGNPSRADKE